jgi:DNA processing protein
MGYELASCGFTIVSGMAKGIDTMAHKGALRACGRTIAVLGAVVDVPYPFVNTTLKSAIDSSGALISEFPLNTPPNREHFPRRNRIISGLSLGVLVVEATLDSGSMITVRYALDQGKEVFAIPGNITSKRSAGTNKLIKNGAKLVEDVRDIIEEISPQLVHHLEHKKREIPPMSENERIVYERLSNEPKHVDILVRELKMSSSQLLSLLLRLELKGVVKQYGGKNFALA